MTSINLLIRKSRSVYWYGIDGGQMEENSRCPSVRERSCITSLLFYKKPSRFIAKTSSVRQA